MTEPVVDDLVAQLKEDGELDGYGCEKAKAALATAFNRGVAYSAQVVADLRALIMSSNHGNPDLYAGASVEKYTGDYQLAGEIRAVYTTKAGKVRYVVEHFPGFQHIYSAANIRPLKK